MRRIDQANLRIRGGSAAAAVAGSADHEQSTPENPSAKAILHSWTHCVERMSAGTLGGAVVKNLLGARLRACNQL
jgi:hypothetical protein